MKDESRKIIKKRIFFLPFAAIIILIVTGGYLFYHSEESSLRKQKYEELSAIAKLKINQIIQWRNERLYEAEFFSSNLEFIQNTKHLLSGKDKYQLDKYFTKTLLPVKQNHGYDNIYLVSTKDKVIFSLNKNKQTNDIDSTTIKNIDLAITNKKNIFSDFHFSVNHKVIHLNIIAPVLDKNKIPIAVLIFRVLPNNYLYPLLQQWPIPSKTSEVLLVRKDGDNVLYLNELRYRKNTALNFRIPLSEKDVPAVQAVLGFKGIFEGKDYRGIDVLSDIRAIPGTPWYMVTKVDQSEIYSELYFREVVISILAFVLIFSFGMGLIWFYYFRQRNIYKALWQTQEEFRTTLYSIGDAVITTDKYGIVKQMNHIAEQLTGWNEAEAKGKPLLNVFKIINEESRNTVESPVKKVLLEGLILGFANHTLLISKDGKEIPIADSGAPIKDEDQNIIGVVLVFRDQTEERAARKALEASERKFRHTFEFASIGKSITSLDGKLVEVNDAFCKIINYSKDELEITNFAEITHPDDLDISIEIMRSLLAGEKETYRVEKRYIKKDGTEIWTDVNTMLLKDSQGNPEYFITHVVDINERKKAEDELKKFFNLVPDMVCIASTDGYFKKINYMWEKVLGFTEQEILETPLMNFVHHDDKEATLKEVAKQVDGLTTINFINRYRCKNGEYKWLEWVAAPAENKTLLYAAARDITEHKIAEEELRESEKRYRSLFENMIVGFAYCKMIYEDGKPTDFVYLNVNDAFEKLTGLKNVVGKNVTDVIPNIKKDSRELFEIYSSVALTGKPERFEVYLDSLDMWFYISVYSNQKEHFIAVFDVITERKRAEQALRESEKTFRNLFELSTDPILLLNDTGFIDCNQSTISLLGYPSKDEFLKKQPWEISPEFQPDGISSIKKAKLMLDKALEHGYNRFEWIHLKYDGSKIPVEVMLTNIISKGEQLFYTIWRDITQRKLAEEKILNANRVYAVISQINQAIVRLKDRDELFKEVCSIAIEFGKFQMAWVGLVDEQTGLIKPLLYAGKEDDYLSKIKNISIKNIPEGRGPTGTAMREGRYIICNDIQNDPIMALWKDEALKRNYRSSIALPINPFGKVIGAFTLYSSVLNFFDREEINLLNEVASDISFFLEAIEIEKRRKETELSLRESEEKFRMVFENVFDGIGIFSEDNDLSKRKLIECNERYAAMAGRNREELLRIGIMQGLQIALEDNANENRLEALYEGTVYRGSFSWIRPDGKENVVEYVGMPVMWRGKPYTVGIDRDITERKKILEELIHAKEKAENSDKLKTEFLAQVSHEIRTPLVSIVNYSDLIEADIKEGNIVYIPEYLEAVSNAGKRIQRTFDLIVNVAQVITHNYEPNFTTFNLVKNVLVHVYHEFKTPAEQKGLEYILIDNANDHNIFADEYSVTQLFSNLLDNAIKYTKEGFVKLEVTREDEAIIVKVMDSGIGISNEFLPYIFAPFRQEDQGYSRKYDGNGLGLTLVKYYCEINDAGIGVESVKNEGTIFTVKFKVQK